MNRCDCSVGDKCPLGRIGSNLRCTANELREALIELKRERIAENRKPGFYWVMIDDQWDPAKWENNKWYMDSTQWAESEFQEVDERIILRDQN